MGLDGVTLARELEGLEAQREALVAQLHRVEGSIATVRYLAGRAMRQEDEAKAQGARETDGTE